MSPSGIRTPVRRHAALAGRVSLRAAAAERVARVGGPRTGARSSPLRIGLAFNRKPDDSTTAASHEVADPGRVAADLYAEWDDEVTIAALETALQEAGEVTRLEATEDFPLLLREARPDIVFNVAEGLWGPSREAHVPALCEFWAIPYTGSDPLTLALCLDKGRAKEILAYQGIPTAEFAVVPGGERLDGIPPPPVVVKPIHEGSSKGITQASLCRTRAEVGRAVGLVWRRYRQPALVER